LEKKGRNWEGVDVLFVCHGSMEIKVDLQCHIKDLHHPKEKGGKPSINRSGLHNQQDAKMNH